MAITLNGKHRIRTSIETDQKMNKELTIGKFIELHDTFVREKVLENLSPKTINDHKYLFTLFTRWLESSYWFDRNQYSKKPLDQYISKTLFMDYKEYMLFEKNYAACTVNIRLRILKTYINWLYANKHIKVNYNNFLSIVKVSDDRVHPLSKEEVKKLINAIGDSTYARYRDLIIAITILDTGIRINELLQLTYNDINFKDAYIIVQASISKTRTERILPISKHTLQYLEQLKDIALEQGQEHLFLSTTGDRRISNQDIFLISEDTKKRLVSIKNVRLMYYVTPLLLKWSKKVLIYTHFRG